MQPALLIVLAGLMADRERKGFAYCEKWGIGRSRAIIGEALPMITEGPLAEFAAGQREAALVLETECLRCGGCKLGRSVTEPAPLLRGRGRAAVGGG